MKYPDMSNVQLGALTSLRGLLALWVVIFHFRAAMETLFPAFSVLSPITSQGNLAVPAFFALSGFVLSIGHGNDFSRDIKWALLRFYALRLARIYPVHIATMLCVGIIGIALYWLDYLNNLHAFSKRELLYNSFLIHMWRPIAKLSWNYPSWSISSEWFAYITFPLFAVLMARLRQFSSKEFFFMTSGLLSLVGVVYYSRGYQQTYFGIICIIPYFVSGMLFYNAWGCLSLQNGKFFSPLSWCAVFVSVSAPFFLEKDIAVILILLGLLFLIASLALCGDRAPRFWSSSWVKRLGESSFSLYMTHALVQILLYNVLPAENYANHTVLARFTVFGVYVLTIWLACFICYKYCELPSRQGLKGIISRRLTNR